MQHRWLISLGVVLLASLGPAMAEPPMRVPAAGVDTGTTVSATRGASPASASAMTGTTDTTNTTGAASATSAKSTRSAGSDANSASAAGTVRAATAATATSAATAANRASPQKAPTAWFTITGDALNPALDVVQVDPVSFAKDGALKTMNVRVNRSAMRKNWTGLPYRSYESQVLFDCRAQTGHYLVVTFYDAPLWAGVPSRTTDYSIDPPPMRFRDMEPNPTERLVRAACRIARYS